MSRYLRTSWRVARRALSGPPLPQGAGVLRGLPQPAVGPTAAARVRPVHALLRGAAARQPAADADHAAWLESGMLLGSASVLLGWFLAPSAEPCLSEQKRGGARPSLSPYFIADAAEKVAPAVVNITVEHKYGTRVIGLVATSGGSGFIIDPEGVVLTNAHVVQGLDNHKKTSLAVSMQDGRTFRARVVGFDEQTDLAVLQLEGVNKPLPSAELGTSNKLRPGEWVVVLGSPLQLQNSVSAGIISNVDRKGADLGMRGARTEYIQTDAAINKGNSGGPLVNLEGQVIGISCMTAEFADGVSFAIPVDTAKQVVAQIRKNGKVTRRYLGIKMLELKPDLIAHFQERDPDFPDVKDGILVVHVAPDSPAEIGGIRPGDVITELNGKSVSRTQQMIDAMAQETPISMKIKLIRDGKEVILSFF